MKQKKYQAMLVAVLTGVCMVSCSDWFDVIPRSSVYEDDLYKNEIGFQQVATGLYLDMGNDYLYGKAASYGLVDVVSGMYAIQRTQNTVYKYAMQYNYEYSSTKSSIGNIWSKAYNVIANANELLRKAGISQDVDVEQTKDLTISDVFATEQTRNILCGEALAVRAYLHFDLLRIFGVNPKVDANKPGIPYVTTLQKYVTAQSTVGEALEKVITDLLQAERLLKDSDPIVEGNPVPADDYFKKVTRPTHANYYAVCGMLARAYLYAGKKAEAGQWAQIVIDANAFRWTKSAELNNGDYLGMNELVFNLFIRDMKDRITPYFRYTAGSDTEQLLPISATDYVEWYDSRDKRRKGFLTYDGSYLSQKYVVTSEDVGDTLSLQRRIPLIRLSEMYYIAAESRLSDNVEKAGELLDEVRKARGLKAKEYADTSDVQTEIDNEYHREFVAEGQLFYYIKRRDMPGMIETQYKVDFVFPLPDDEYTYGNRKPNK